MFLGCSETVGIIAQSPGIWSQIWQLSSGNWLDVKISRGKGLLSFNFIHFLSLEISISKVEKQIHNV